MAQRMPRTASGWVAWVSPGLLILVGAVLFFVPAPPTSLIGIGLIVVGAALWLIDYFGGELRGRASVANSEKEGETVEIP